MINEEKITVDEDIKAKINIKIKEIEDKIGDEIAESY